MVAYYIDKLIYIKDLDLDKILLDRYITKIKKSYLLKTTNIYLINNSLFLELFCSSSFLYISIGEFSNHSSNIAVNPIFDKAIPISIIKLLLDALDYGII